MFGSRPAWGKYLTQMQQVQFVLMNAHGIYLLYNGCPYPSGILTIYLVYIFLMLLLFMNFYFQKHCRKSSSAKPKSA